jgi:hypothetical protein
MASADQSALAFISSCTSALAAYTTTQTANDAVTTYNNTLNDYVSTDQTIYQNLVSKFNSGPLAEWATTRGDYAKFANNGTNQYWTDTNGGDASSGGNGTCVNKQGTCGSYGDASNEDQNRYCVSIAQKLGKPFASDYVPDGNKQDCGSNCILGQSWGQSISCSRPQSAIDRVTAAYNAAKPNLANWISAQNVASACPNNICVGGINLSTMPQYSEYPYKTHSPSQTPISCCANYSSNVGTVIGNSQSCDLNTAKAALATAVSTASNTPVASNTPPESNTPPVSNTPPASNTNTLYIILFMIIILLFLSVIYYNFS